MMIAAKSLPTYLLSQELLIISEDFSFQNIFWNKIQMYT